MDASFYEAFPEVPAGGNFGRIVNLREESTGDVSSND